MNRTENNIKFGPKVDSGPISPVPDFTLSGTGGIGP